MLVLARTPPSPSSRAYQCCPGPSGSSSGRGGLRPSNNNGSSTSSNRNRNRHTTRELGEPPRSGIERLPPRVQRRIFSHLDYASLIYLSTMNRHFQRAVDPQAMASPADKIRFVLQAAREFPQHRPCERGPDFRPGNFECYACFRVRGPEHFDALQRQHAHVDAAGRLVLDRPPRPDAGDRPVSLRRFCIQCGVALGLHAPLDCLTTKTGLDLWVCRCRLVWTKPGCMRCPTCAADCPLRPRIKPS